MNILFEIADRDLMIVGIILVAILVVAAIIFKAAFRGAKVKPISEDERFDSEDNEVKPSEITEEQVAAKAELERVYEQMSADLENQEGKKDNIDEFEREQEENAIISYQELMAKAQQLKEETHQYETHVEENADMKVREAMNTYQQHTSKESIEEKSYHGFKNSEIISPIYGIQREHKEKSSTKTQTNGIIGRAYEEINPKSENEQNVDFLNSLKEFRRNL